MTKRDVALAASGADALALRSQPRREQPRAVTGVMFRRIVLLRVMLVSVAVTGAITMAGCVGVVKSSSSSARDGQSLFDLRQPTPTTEFGSTTNVASFDTDERVRVMLPMIEFELFARGVNLFAPFDQRDPADPGSEPNVNPINEVELWLVTSDDVDEVFTRVDEVIDIFGVDATAERELNELRQMLATTSASDDLSQKNAFLKSIVETDEYGVYLQINRGTDDELHTIVSVRFDNGVYGPSVYRWPADE